MQGVFGELEPAAPSPSPALLHHIGSHLKTGILATAAQKEIPVYCPAVQDSMVGLQYWLFSQTNKVTVDAFADMPALLDTCFAIKKAGALLVGGGVPKNFILQSMLMTPNGFDYAVQFTGDRPDLGGLSGATLDEARSMGQDHRGGAGCDGLRRCDDHAPGPRCGRDGAVVPCLTLSLLSM